MTRSCCTTWDANQVIAETRRMRAVLDAYPVVPGHVLVYPTRHVEWFDELRPTEALDLHRLVAEVQRRTITSWTIGINDGPAAGRTVSHLHVHVIPRRLGDVPDPRGGVRRLLIPDPASDPWISHVSTHP